jgi:hypothetical protein
MNLFARSFANAGRSFIALEDGSFGKVYAAWFE